MLYCLSFFDSFRLKNGVRLLLLTDVLFWFLTECDGGKFGQNCDETCGKCVNGEHCDHVNGTCFNGCDRGFKGFNCNEGMIYNRISF